MTLPKLVRSLELVVFDFAHGKQLSVHRLLKTVNREPLVCQSASGAGKTVNSSFRLPGFSLIELLVVMSIIAILIASLSFSWQNAQQKGRDGKRKSDLKAIQQSLEAYFQTNGKYPDSSNGQIKCNIITPLDDDEIAWGDTFNCDYVVYMQQLPKDPAYQATAGYFYSQGTTPLQYTLSAQIENSKDTEIFPQTILPCTPANGRNYCVFNP